MGTLYWSIFALALGGCIGSFLNVVIYRWPLGLSVHKPARSFCPVCRQQIAWYDNLPVLSYLWLRARCRRCGVSISLQYPAVELATALMFLITYDAFFLARLRMGVGNASADWVILLAHWGMAAGLIVLTVMDLEAYMVDIRVTWLVSLTGVIGHLFWTPAGSEAWLRPGPIQAFWALAVAAGLGLGVWLVLAREPEAAEDVPAPSEPVLQPPEGVHKAQSLRWLWLILPTAMVGVYLLATLEFSGRMIQVSLPAISVGAESSVEWRAVLVSSDSLRVAAGVLLLFLGLALSASEPHAEADAEIVEAIQAEAPDARRVAFWELKLLAPAIVLSTAVLLVLVNQPGYRESLWRLLQWRAWGDWRPLWGLSTALSGWVIGGAVGWLARIGFTFLFGKEALGMGDVHILAAAGAVAGWPVAVMGFFLGAMLALAGLIVIRLRRQSWALPYGPWLGLGFFLAAMFQDRILDYLNIRWLLG